jgi:hypothetical protein
LVGRAEPLSEGEDRQRLKSRYLRRHPQATLYADFPDFAFWQFAISRASLNGGFGKAYAMAGADLETPLDALLSLADIEEDAIAHMNTDHAEAVERYATFAGAKHTGWRLSAIDPEGLDLSSGDEVIRLWFDRPLASAADLRPALVALAKKS